MLLKLECFIVKKFFVFKNRYRERPRRSGSAWHAQAADCLVHGSFPKKRLFFNIKISRSIWSMNQPLTSCIPIIHSCDSQHQQETLDSIQTKVFVRNLGRKAWYENKFMSYGFAIRSSDVHQLEIYFSCIEKKKVFPGKYFLERSFVVRGKMFWVPGSWQQVLYEFFMRHVHYTTVSLHFLPLTGERSEFRCNASEFNWKIHFLCRKTSSRTDFNHSSRFQYLFSSHRQEEFLYFRLPAHLVLRPTHMWLNSTSFVSIYFRHFELDSIEQKESKKRSDKDVTKF